MTSGTDPPGSDVRTFLIADVRGYTRFTQEEGDEAAARLAARFAEVAREVVESRGGTVVELRGDEALCVFGSPRQAVRAAVAFQQRCAEEIRADPSLPLRVGIGLDSGEAVAVAGGYRGGALNLAARLCSIARAGEVLVSEGVVHFGHRVDDVTYTDRGQVRLKGLARPVRYHQAQFGLDLPDDGSGKPSRAPRVVLALGAVVAVVAVAGAVALRGSGDPASTLEANVVGQFDGRSGRLVRQTRLRGSPQSLSIGQGHVWAADPAGSRIVGIDLRDGALVSAGTGGSGVDAVAVSDESIWVLHGDNSTLVRVDPVQLITVGDPLTVGAGASAAVVADGDVWVANTDEGTVQRIDGRTGRSSPPLPVGPQPVALAFGLGSVWVLDEAGGTLTQIDPQAGQIVATGPAVGVGARAVAVGFGAVWIANPDTDDVIRFDPSDPAALRHVRVPGRPGSVAVAGGAVWAGTASGNLVRIDPAKVEVESTRDVSSPVAALAGSGDRLYVAAQARLEEHRGGDLRVVIADLDSLDPALAYLPESWSVLSITNDGLVGFQRVGGATGSLLVPDLATAIPTPTDDGRTYRFVLRDGMRYSNGEPVRPSDLRRAVERALSAQAPPLPGAGPAAGPGGPFFAKLVGASACHPGRPCDMRRGVIADDAAGTVEFRLTSPDARFLYALALPFAFPVPAGVTPGDPVPATGAYMVRRFEPARGSGTGSLELVRNPQFRVWSPAARPDGFPDRILWRVGATADAQLSEVEQGDADVAPSTNFTLVPRFERLAIRYPSQVHIFAAGQVLAVFMNTRVPPFDDIRVRKAVGYALDRRRMAGPTAGSVTCQILPPGIPGYRPYCPYTPGGGPEYRGPAFDRALRLVRASGTRGMAVTVWLTDIGNQGFLRYSARTLRNLGYRVRTRFLPPVPYFSRVLAPGSTMQFGGYGWVQDYPAPADFLALIFACGSQLNPARFCDRPIDRQMARASMLDRTDPAAANLAWARIDEQVTDAAAWIPFVNPSGANFVSTRVGNYSRNPQWGLLIEQLWVN